MPLDSNRIAKAILSKNLNIPLQMVYDNKSAYALLAEAVKTTQKMCREDSKCTKGCYDKAW